VRVATRRDSYTPEQFSRIVARETDTVERKTGLGQQPIQEAMVAFSNGQGGIIYVGVSDDGTVPGRELDQGSDDRIHAAANDARDVGRYSIRQISVGTVPVIAIEIKRREEGFAQTSDGRTLVRRGGRNQALFGADLARFIQERTLRRFELTDTDLSLDAVEPELLIELRRAYDWPARGVQARLIERGLTSRDGMLTVAGALFLTDPGRAIDQHKAVIEVRRYPHERAEYDRREEFGGPLHHQVRDATKFVTDELGSELVVTGLYRHELPRLPEVVVREALANAVAHRSYEAHGTATLVELRPDRVSVTSPGSLPEPVTVENIRQAQAARNQNVIDVLRRFKLAEDAGRGVDVMEDSMRAVLLGPPRFFDDGHSVCVELPLGGPITPQERVWVAALEGQGVLEPDDRLLLVHAARGERITNSSARIILSTDEGGARRALRRLMTARLLTQHGQRGGAYYRLVEDIAPPAAYRLSGAELAALVIEEAAREPLTNERVRVLTGLDRAQSLALLRRLVAEGKLRQVGERRGTRYLPV
jgi:ATP-dependent DNA helicase RecG